MEALRRSLFAALLALLATQAVAAEVSFPSADGKVQLVGRWYPAAGDGPRPAVLALHGCNGMRNERGEVSGVWNRYAGYFNAEGMHMLALDSFGPRGLRSICEIPSVQRTVNEEHRRDDAYAALRWLAQQAGVDASRLVVAGWSHGGQAVLSVMDATDKAVQAQAVKPRAAVAFYPGCHKFNRMFNYALAAPMLLMIGELDDWTPAPECVALHRRIARPDAPAFELVVYPGSYHAFDGFGPVTVRPNVGTTRSGQATVGGNPQAREQSHARMFEFLSAQVGVPLALTHAQRMYRHLDEVPPRNPAIDANDLAAVPVSEAGRARYQHYLGLPSPKAFVVTERGGWYFSSPDARAMRNALEACKAQPCWLYAVDDQVVWQAEPSARTGLSGLRPASLAGR
jgi:dienelactone hydrolase